jgi:DNA-binding transcriptional ArsR family regulator
MKTHYQTQAALLKALAHPVRLAILDVLRRQEACVCHLEAALHRRQAYISQQLMQLREAGLIDSRKDGRLVYHWITDSRVVGLLDVMLGPLPENTSRRVDGCTCPRCTGMIEIDSITLVQEDLPHAHD